MNPKESTEPMSIDYTPGPLLDAARNTPTALWNDSADPDELRQSISFGGVGATCNPTIAYTCINQRKDVWLPRIAELAEEMPEATESEIGWQVVREMSIEAAKLLEPIFEEHKGRNGRLSMQTDPRLARSAKALADQAEEFSNLAKNIIVKIPATSVGVKAIEDATYRGVSVNVTVSFSVPQAVATGEAIERGLKRREAEGKDVSTMGPVVTLMGGRLDDWLKIVAKRDKLFIDPAPTRSSRPVACAPACCRPPSATCCSGPSWSAATWSSPRPSPGRSSSTTPTTRSSSASTSPWPPRSWRRSCRSPSSCAPTSPTA